jgi:hypothetical protein
VIQVEGLSTVRLKKMGECVVGRFVVIEAVELTGFRSTIARVLRG